MDRQRSTQRDPANHAGDEEPAWADVPWWAVGLTFAPVYLLAILLGYAFFLTPNSISALWPAGGVALAALTLTRYRMWPMLVVLITGIEVAIPQLLAGADIVAIASPANVLEPVLGATLLRWVAGRRVDVSRLRHALALVIFAALIPPAIAAVPGATKYVALEPSISFVAAWQVWWIGGALGVVVAAPVILSWASHPRVKPLPKERVAELVLLGSLIVLAGVWVLGAPAKPLQSILDFPIVTFPLLIWATLRFDVRVVSIASMMVAFFTVWSATLGRGPFMMIVAESVQANILAIESFIATVVLSALLLSAALADRRRAELARAALQAQVAEAQKLELVARLAGSVAHDFNNDLTIMMSWTDYLEDRAAGNEEVKRAVTQISRAAHRASSITNQLLSFGRTPPGPKQTVNVADLTSGWTTLLRPLFHGPRGIDVSAESDVGYVRADPHQLEQVLLNLAINARDAMPAGGLLRIEATRSDSAGKAAAQPMVCISVADDGDGMGQPVLDQIFEPFFTTKVDGRGTGLGLPSVQRIVDQLGGRIEVESTPGEGTTFRIYLPAVSAPKALPGALSETRVQATETVLVVDDDDDVRDAVVLALESGGYTALRASNGSDALQVLEQHADIVELVVTDLNMPVRGGEELIDDLAKLHPDVPVIVVSGYSSSENADLPAEVSFVPKPFSTKMLLACVRQALDNR
jgi:signal transduction histidine kinase/CheY-like chemotaxis protein